LQLSFAVPLCCNWGLLVDVMSLAELTSRCSSAPEPESLHVAAENVAAFSLPQEALSFQPGDDVFSMLGNGEEERKIHCNTELRKDEQEHLLDLWKEAARRDDNFPPSVAVTATRYLSFTRGDHLSALEHMRQTHAWRCSYFKDGPLTDSAMEEDLRHGAVYFSGRDRALRPLLVIRPARVPGSWLKERRSDKLLDLLVFCMEYFVRYMILPGKVENLSVILDLQGVGVSNLPLSALTEIYKVMSHHYIIRVFRFYVCNMPMLLGTVAGQFKRIMTERQRQKLFFVRDPKVLADEFAAHQLEQDLGGGRPMIKEFFPFPLQPGPFAAHCRHPRSDAVPNVHEAISAAGMRGRLWDPAASHFDNTRLEFTDVAEAILRRCSLPVPPSLPEQRKDTVLWLKASGKDASPKHRVSTGRRSDDTMTPKCQASLLEPSKSVGIAVESLPSDGCIDIPLTEDADDEEFWSPQSSVASDDVAQDCTMLHPREDSAERETELGSSNEDGDGDIESPRDEFEVQELPILELERDVAQAEYGADPALSDAASALGDSYNLLHESDAEAIEIERRRKCGPNLCCHMCSRVFWRRAQTRQCSTSHGDGTARELALEMLEPPPEQLRMTLLEAQ